jgi:import receptor subunit TOM70
MAPASSKVVEANTSDKLKKFFEDKDWKFYCAVAAGLTLAGASAYYISSSSKKGKKKPEETKKEVGKSRAF